MVTLSLSPLLAAQDIEWAERLDHAVEKIAAFGADGVAPRASDAEFLRRVHLDLVGAPPSAAEARAFLDDPAPDKRARLVERLSSSEDFAAHWARRYREAWLGSEVPLFDIDHPWPEERRRRLMERFEAWLRQALRRDDPLDAIASVLLTARGDAEESPATAYLLQFYGGPDPLPMMFAGGVSRQLAGVDMSCALCHDHPFDRWSINDSWALAAFAAGLRRTTEPRPRLDVGPELAQAAPAGPAQNARLFLGGAPAAGEDGLSALARLLPRSEQFDRAAANRVWAWLFGRGIVPVEDFNIRNRPLSPALLETLAQGFRANGRSLRALVRTLCATKAYQRTSEAPAPPRRLVFDRQIPSALSEEQLRRAIATATGVSPPEHPAPLTLAPGRFAGSCAVSARPSELLRALTLRNDEEIRGWLEEGPALRDIRRLPPGERIEALFLAALSRRPTPGERARFERFVEGRPTGLEDAFWALLNSTEFRIRP